MRFKIYILQFFVCIFIMVSCKTKQVTYEMPMEPVTEIEVEKVVEEPSVNDQKTTGFKLGIEVLQQIDFAALKGKRVGLVTNPTGVDRNLKSTLDILHESKNVNLVALFGPEHGVRGNFSAGDEVNNQTDEKTGLPVFSLYGKDKKPNREAMDLVDVMIYDIQDIGVRSYTYISTMGLVMEAAADYNKEVIILDRPNPLGCEKVEGPLVHDGFYSFVSQFKIPYVYGLTCGELARLLNFEGLLANGKKCQLQVIPMQGYSREMDFDATGLHWVPTSPHIPNSQTAYYYATTGILGELNPTLIGIGYTLPFQSLVTETIDADQLANAMNALNLAGVIFRPTYYKPYYKEMQGKELQGVQIHITDFKKVNLTEIQFFFLQEAHKIEPKFNPFNGNENRYRMFDMGCGTDSIRLSMMKDFNFEKVRTIWNGECQNFKELSRKYYLY
ncbi:MAG: DUF1343 domain-containing protein [Salinivirgaceae bacterium]